MGQRGPLRKKPRTNQASSEDTTVVTPSYHLYPPNYIFDAFSGETEQDKRVINYKVFLCKEEERKALEDYDGVRWRKNVHEGVLNRVGSSCLSFVLCDFYLCVSFLSRWKMKCTK